MYTIILYLNKYLLIMYTLVMRTNYKPLLKVEYCIILFASCNILKENEFSLKLYNIFIYNTGIKCLKLKYHIFGSLF